jgi:hypothetical protein
VTVVNHLVNFGWEYVYHCHLLAHEEMDMMHSVAFAVEPQAPDHLTAIRQGSRTILNWADNSVDETGFTIQRANNVSFTTGVQTFTVEANVTTYTDKASGSNGTHYYRVFATNTVGDKDTPGFPTMTVNSAFSNTTADQPYAPLAPPAEPSNVTATAVAANNKSASVTLTWTDNATNEAGFRIQRATNAAFTSGLTTATVGANVTSLTQTVSRNSDFYFRIQSYNSADPSAWVNATPFPIHTP